MDDYWRITCLPLAAKLPNILGFQNALRLALFRPSTVIIFIRPPFLILLLLTMSVSIVRHHAESFDFNVDIRSFG
jgi:hypothetical protein